MRFDEFNSQNQPKVTWPPSFIVARAYLDQLERGQAIDGARAKALRTAFDQGDKRNKGALDELEKAAADLETGAAASKDPARYKALAEAIRTRTARLR